MRSLGSATLIAALLAAAPLAAQEDGGGAVDTELAEEGVVATDTTDEGGTGLSLAERIRAVSNPVFRKHGRFELAPIAGISVSDSFFRRWTVGARASYHLIDSLSIDVGGAWNAWSEPLDAAIFLGAPRGVTVADPAPLYGYADAGVTFAPFYGKVSLMSEWIVHFDTYLSGGGGAIFSDAKDGIVQPALEVGIGGRLLLTPWLALRADMRDYFYLADFGDGSRLQSLVLVNIGIGIFFPFSFEDDRDVVKGG